MNNQASQGLGLEALNMFAGLISTQKASFRLVSSATTTMFSMSDGTLRHEGTQTTIRNVKTEVYIILVLKIIRNGREAGGGVEGKRCVDMYTGKHKNKHISPKAGTSKLGRATDSNLA